MINAIDVCMCVCVIFHDREQTLDQEIFETDDVPEEDVCFEVCSARGNMIITVRPYIAQG